MKNFILIAMILTSFSVYADSFYYYNGGKVNLAKDSTKFVIFSKQDVSHALLEQNGYNVCQNFADDISKVTLVEGTSSISMSKVRKMMSSQSNKVNIQPCYKHSSGMELTPTGYIYVALKIQSDYAKLQRVSILYNCTIVRQNKFMPLWYTLHLTEESGLNPVDVANAIYETGEFASSSPSFSYDPLMISYDPDVKDQWGLYNPNYEGIDISASKAWNYATGRGIKVAVIDQGIELTHDDLKDNLYPLSYDAYTGKSPSGIYNTERVVGHGTLCAGVIGATRNNNINITGVAPDVRLMSISVNFDGLNNSEHTADGINWAWQNGADVLSCSWGGPESDFISTALNNAITNGREKKGCIIVCAAGNFDAPVLFPANYREEIIAVANLKEEGIIEVESCYGLELLVCAPGTNIVSTMVGNTIEKKSGTSLACPYVAGVAALILERNPSLTAVQVREIIARTAKKIGHLPYSIPYKYGKFNRKYGYGLVDAYKAVKNTPRN